ncbi:unnamed protein product, partial [Onchocerca flexuosa]|uniref:ATP-dependent DNA helicase n=1 Tax=Onchocerca flexuosa TaxID=387005 RepID=A0A183HVE4_9BILA
MPTCDVLCQEYLDQQIRNHIILMSTGSVLLDFEDCENLSNNKNKNDDGDGNDNDDMATATNKSSNTSAENPELLETVSTVVKLVDS